MSAPAPAPAAKAAGPAAPAARPGVWARLRRRKGSSVALAILALVVGGSLLAPILPLPNYAEMRPSEASAPPSPAWRDTDPSSLERLEQEHPWGVAVRSAVFGEGEWAGALGTDSMGRDVLARLVWGARVSLMVGLVATLVAMFIGTSWGLIAGFVGGRLDAFLMRVVDALYSVPFLFVVILVIAVLRDFSSDLREYGVDRLVILYVVIGAISWLTMARIVRGQVLALRDRDFVLATRALGSGPVRILTRHLLPNLWGIIVVYLTLTVPRVMLFEAFLSFLGLGVEPPGVSWGILASEGLESLSAVSVTWWLVVFPGLALVITLSALNTLGDALRDALDPRLVR